MPDQDYVDNTLAAADAPPPESERKPDDPAQLTGASWKYALRRAVKESSSDGVTDLASMLTYYTVLSLAPALLAVFSIISLVLRNNADIVTSMLDQWAQEYVPADYQDMVLDLIETLTGSAAGGTIALIIGVLTALWSASAYVKAFSRSSNIIYGRGEGRGVIMQTATMLLTTLAMLLGLVLILVALALNETLVSALLGPIAEPLGLGGTLTFMTEAFLPVWEWVKWPVILALLIALIAVLYHYTPNVRPPKFAWLSLGSVIAILGIVIAGVALYIYFRFFGGYSAYGAVGGVMALLLTLWVFNIVLLFGVEVDAEAERARELQADLPAEDNIQLPPRAVKQAQKQKKSQDQLERQASELREKHGGKAEDAERETNEPEGARESDRRGQRDRDGRAQPGAGSTPSSGLDAE